MVENEFVIENAQYYNDLEGNRLGIRADINGQDTHVPIAEGNRHYDMIMQLVDSGELTIAETE